MPDLPVRSRETLAKKIVIEKVAVKAAAAAFTVGRRTAAGGLRDRSSRPS
jgi:hypothetical protein